jgi:hypothetical protein
LKELRRYRAQASQAGLLGQPGPELPAAVPPQPVPQPEVPQPEVQLLGLRVPESAQKQQQPL